MKKKTAKFIFYVQLLFCLSANDMEKNNSYSVEAEELIAERAVDHHREDQEKPTLFDTNREELETESHHKKQTICPPSCQPFIGEN